MIIGLGRRDGAWPQLAGRLEQRAAQVLEQAQPVGRHGEAAPAGQGPVQDGPHQGEAAGLAGEPADDLDPAAGFAEGALKIIIERTNKEIKRRTDVVGVFPSPPSLLRLAGAVLAEIHDEWQVSDRRILSEASIAKLYEPAPAAQTGLDSLASTAQIAS